MGYITDLENLLQQKRSAPGSNPDTLLYGSNGYSLFNHYFSRFHTVSFFNPQKVDSGSKTGNTQYVL